MPDCACLLSLRIIRVLVDKYFRAEGMVGSKTVVRIPFTRVTRYVHGAYSEGYPSAPGFPDNSPGAILHAASARPAPRVQTMLVPVHPRSKHVESTVFPIRGSPASPLTHCAELHRPNSPYPSRAAFFSLEIPPYRPRRAQKTVVLCRLPKTIPLTFPRADTT